MRHLAVRFPRVDHTESLALDVILFNVHDYDCISFDSLPLLSLRANVQNRNIKYECLLLEFTQIRHYKETHGNQIVHVKHIQRF